MSRGYPSMTALLGLLAVAGYQEKTRSQNGSMPHSERRGPRRRDQEEAPVVAFPAIWDSWAGPASATC